MRARRQADARGTSNAGLGAFRERRAVVDDARERCPGCQPICDNVPVQVMTRSVRERECGRIGAMSDPRTAPYGSVRLADVDTLAQVDPGNPDINDCEFHLVRRHFDVQAFGVNAATGNAGDEMIEEHHEADDERTKQTATRSFTQ